MQRDDKGLSEQSQDQGARCIDKDRHNHDDPWLPWTSRILWTEDEQIAAFLDYYFTYLSCLVK